MKYKIKTSNNLVLLHTKEPEHSRVEHFELLRKHKHQPIHVRDQPRVNRLITLVGRHQDFWHLRQNTLQRKLLQVGGQLFLADVHDLVLGGERLISVNHLVAVGHRFRVGVLDADLQIRQQ